MDVRRQLDETEEREGRIAEMIVRAKAQRAEIDRLLEELTRVMAESRRVVVAALSGLQTIEIPRPPL
jgi:F0F1-type ATP synthase membrane subunit b/b'